MQSIIPLSVRLSARQGQTVTTLVLHTLLAHRGWPTSRTADHLTTQTDTGSYAHQHCGSVLLKGAHSQVVSLAGAPGNKCSGRARSEDAGAAHVAGAPRLAAGGAAAAGPHADRAAHPAPAPRCFPQPTQVSRAATPNCSPNPRVFILLQTCNSMLALRNPCTMAGCRSSCRRATCYPCSTPLHKPAPQCMPLPQHRPREPRRMCCSTLTHPALAAAPRSCVARTPYPALASRRTSSPCRSPQEQVNTGFQQCMMCSFASCLCFLQVPRTLSKEYGRCPQRACGATSCRRASMPASTPSRASKPAWCARTAVEGHQSALRTR